MESQLPWQSLRLDEIACCSSQGCENLDLIFGIYALPEYNIMQGAPKNEEWAGWEGTAAKEEKPSHTNDDWGKW